MMMMMIVSDGGTERIGLAKTAAALQHKGMKSLKNTMITQRKLGWL
jgi:hypothetical protein